MKKVLLTTTALVMTAGVASAEISFGGKVQTSMAATGANDMTLNTHIDLNATVSATADNGLTMSTSVGYDAGIEADYNDDFTIDGAESGWGTGAPEVALSFEGFTFTAQEDGIDNLYDGDLATVAGDFGVAGSFGGVSFAFTSDNDDDDPSSAFTSIKATSFSVGYTAGDLSVSYASTSDDGTGATVNASGVRTANDTAGAAASVISLSYKMGDATITAKSDNEGAAESTNSIGVSYAMGDITVGYTMAGDQGAGMGDDYDLSLGYKAGALSASFATNEDSRTRLVAEYDLGGATAFFSSQQGGTGSTDFQAVGVNFNF